jgi:hypothetical protein
MEIAKTSQSQLTTKLRGEPPMIQKGFLGNTTYDIDHCETKIPYDHNMSDYQIKYI